MRRLSSKLITKTSPSKGLKKAQRIKKALKLLEGVVSSDLLNFLKTQLKLSCYHSKGRRFDDNFKAWALTLYHISGKAYRFLTKLFNLPSKKTLTNTVATFASDVGFTEKSLYVIKQRADSLPAAGKICYLLMDEISLKSHLFYDISKDHLVGLEDFGDGKSSGLVANSALVLMARGILHNWKQPIAYFLVNESCDAYRLKDIISEALLHLESMGLNVVSIISDQGLNFLSFIQSENVTAEQPYIQMRGKNSFVIFDPPHLLQSVRNNLLKYNFEFENKEANWDDMKSFYNKEQKQAIRTAPKLTERHINPNGFMKMRVKLADQIFSHSVAAGITLYASLGGFSKGAIGTAEFLERVDKIFDTCNSLSFKNAKKQRRPFSQASPHLKIMKDGIQLFKSLKVINKATKEDKTNKLKCLNGWLITLNSMISLWEKLFQSGTISFLVTRQLNQDSLEIFFGSIRQQGGNSDNPTPIQFKRAYRKLFHTNLLKITSGNCEEDADHSLTELSSVNDIVPLATESMSPLKFISSEYTTEDIQSKVIKHNSLAYVAGFLLKRTFERHQCSTCKSYLTDNHLDDKRKLFLVFKANDTDTNLFGGFTVPSKAMTDFLIKLEDIFVRYFRNLRKVKPIGNEILEIMEKEILNIQCV